MSPARPASGTICIRHVARTDREGWLRLRGRLWPECTPEQHRAGMAEYRADRTKAVFVAARRSGKLVGFLEASIRPFAEACDTAPVGYVEGWYVDPEVRLEGIGRGLVRVAEAWARRTGCKEMGSDCLLENDESRRAHLALGYEERERLIHFRRWLESPALR